MTLERSRYSLRSRFGAAVVDAPRLLAASLVPDGWLHLRNRGERLSISDTPHAVRCEFRWTSSLHACDVFPSLGNVVMARAFARWPLDLRARVPDAAPPRPEASFVIPFRGADRVEQLCAVVASVLGQHGVNVECLVVEQAQTPVARERLPECVEYIHLPHPEGDTRWRKSWAFNVGARAARAPFLFCHDADILAPSGYARAALDLLRGDYQSVHIQRFLFYLSETETRWVIDSREVLSRGVERVRQNWVGGTLAIRRDSYFDVGGFDEDFVDWGGEDNEFFDRCGLLKRFDYGFVPFIHLWHPPQVTKATRPEDAGLTRFHELDGIPPRERARRLHALQSHG